MNHESLQGFAKSLRKASFNKKSGGIKCHLGSHSMKRSAVQEMSENLAPHVFVERCGWFVKNLHSLFDYMVTSPRQDGNSGKTVQGWTKKNSEGDVIGGIPPTLEAIKTSPEKAYTFVKYLFSR